MNQASKPADRFVKIGQVEELLDLSRSTIYEMMKNDFPKPLKLSRRAVRWSMAEVQEYVARRPRTK